MNNELYDRLAANYDQEMMDADNRQEFPFVGYQKVLDFIATAIEEDRHLGKCRILDIGIGTGTVETKIKPEKIEVTGVDHSVKMLEIAQLKMPQGAYFCHDFRKGLPEEIKNDKFDAIIATYALHHLNLDEWLEYVHYLSQHLTVFGKIYIGDIFFLNENEKRHCAVQTAEAWDDSEYYHVYETILAHICDHLALSFVKISFCAGIIIVENYHECTLHHDEVLVKY
jgi:putative AdoMet-dependent methyltransferase